MVNEHSAPIIAAIARVVRLSTRHAWIVIPAFLIAAVLAGGYVARHIAINTDSGKLLSSSLPWRQQEIKVNQLFPQRTDLIVAVIDATTPEAADEAADALVNALAGQQDVIRNISRPDGGEFFARDGVLFLSVDDVRRNMDQLIKAEPFLGTLALDPTLRGILGAISQSLEGVRLKKTTLEDLKPALVAIADALDQVEEGHHPAFSWRKLLSGRAFEPSDLRRFVNIQAVLNYGDLQPGGDATKAVRAAIAKLGLTPDRGVTVRLTGSVPLSDEEFATIADGAALNGVVTIAIVLLILWLALKQARIMLAVLINLAIGLSFTAAVGLWMVGALNLISVAFAVLFIGLGVDFGIQFSVRYRAERFADRDLLDALETTGRRVAAPLLLAAASIAAAFYSFLPTAYVGLSELGLIAGTGMIVAFATTVTLLPALLAVLKPAGEAAPVGWAWLAPLDHFLDKQRNWVVGLTLAAVVLGLPLLRGLSFDFNPLNLRSKHVESVSTLLDLMRDPDTSPNTIDILEPNLASASAMAEKLKQAAGGRQACGRWKASCRKIRMRSSRSSTTPISSSPIRSIPIPSTPRRPRLKPWRRSPRRRPISPPRRATWTVRRPPRRAAWRARLRLWRRRRLRPERKRSDVLVTPLMTMLHQVRELLTAEHVTIDTLPPALKSAWIAADGEVRIEARPSGDGNDNAVLHRFVDAVRKVAPQASGGPVFIVEAAATIVKAFLQAAVWSLLSIALILFVALRRWQDVALTLVPLLVAILVTLEICVAIGLKLNFANIIALPLLLGVGVAFKIYYVMAWRAGEHNFLQSSLTRAVFFSACTTATAFGSLWFSHHPGTSSMGKLMALSLVTTLSAAVLFQPALLATQSKSHHDE